MSAATTTTACRCGETHPRVQSREAALAAGREHARARGDRLDPTQAVRLAALVRPHLGGISPAAPLPACSDIRTGV